jgi:hypothetical protein
MQSRRTQNYGATNRYYVVKFSKGDQRRSIYMTHKNEEEKVVHVFERRQQKTDPKDAFNATPFLIIIAFCIVALIVSIVSGYIYHSSDMKEISSLNEKILFLEKRADTLMEKLNLSLAANSYRDKIKLKDIKIKKTDEKLTISGEVYNSGKRAVVETGITIYFLDDKETIIDREYFASRSSDDSPLKTNQKRKFSYTMQSPPNEVKDVQVVITDIVFKD